jgi:hypothetical protein
MENGCPASVFAKLSSVFLPIGIGPWLVEGSNSPLGWSQMVVFVIWVSLQIALAVVSSKLSVDNSFVGAVNIVTASIGLTFGVAFLSVVVLVLWIIGMIRVFGCRGQRVRRTTKL